MDILEGAGCHHIEGALILAKILHNILKILCLCKNTCGKCEEKYCTKKKKNSIFFRKFWKFLQNCQYFVARGYSFIPIVESTLKYFAIFLRSLKGLRPFNILAQYFENIELLFCQCEGPFTYQTFLLNNLFVSFAATVNA